MEVVTMSSDAFQKISSQLRSMENTVEMLRKKNLYPLEKVWIDSQVVCQTLNISKRTLQTYRDNGILAYSKIGSKIYYMSSDIEAHLNKHYVKSFK
ncbi:helix-turn-helix domain-containing protein [Ancylomarina sp. YFZ004]